MQLKGADSERPLGLPLPSPSCRDSPMNITNFNSLCIITIKIIMQSCNSTAKLHKIVDSTKYNWIFWAFAVIGPTAEADNCDLGKRHGNGLGKDERQETFFGLLRIYSWRFEDFWTLPSPILFGGGRSRHAPRRVFHRRPQPPAVTTPPMQQKKSRRPHWVGGIVPVGADLQSDPIEYQDLQSARFTLK